MSADDIKCEISFWGCLVNSSVWAATPGNTVWAAFWLVLAAIFMIAQRRVRTA